MRVMTGQQLRRRLQDHLPRTDRNVRRSKHERRAEAPGALDPA